MENKLRGEINGARLRGRAPVRGAPSDAGVAAEGHLDADLQQSERVVARIKAAHSSVELGQRGQMTFGNCDRLSICVRERL